MIPGGVAFQPGQDDQQKRLLNGENRPSGSPEGVQEAIKVLSLRLPKVVGAQASAPTPLLKSEGAAGNSRVDSIVAQVMQKYFPTAQPSPAAEAPSFPSPAMEPQATDRPRAAQVTQSPATPQRPSPYNPWPELPRIIVGLPPITDLPEYQGPAAGRPGLPTWDGGGGPPRTGIGTLPNLRDRLDWLPPSGGGGYNEPDMPLI